MDNEYRVLVGPPFSEHHGPYATYGEARYAAFDMRRTFAENYRAGASDVCPTVSVEERVVGLWAASGRPGAVDEQAPTARANGERA